MAVEGDCRVELKGDCHDLGEIIVESNGEGCADCVVLPESTRISGFSGSESSSGSGKSFPNSSSSVNPMRYTLGDGVAGSVAGSFGR